jgi:hypothetical protein
VRKYIVIHIDQHGERHQIGDAVEAATPQDALYTVLELFGAEDDGNYEVCKWWPQATQPSDERT